MASHLAPPAQIERAWHLLTVLVRLGRPARSDELAARCAVSLDLVELLCGIPASPLLLTEDRFVTVSDSAVRALVGFVSKAIAPAVPRVAIRANEERRRCGDLVLKYARKRKARPLVAPGAKRRIVFGSDGGDLGEFRLPNWSQNLPVEVHLSVGDILAKNALEVGISIKRPTSSISGKENALLPLLDSAGAPLSTKNIGHVEGTDEAEKEGNNPEAIIICGVLQVLSGNHDSLDIEDDANTTKAIIAGQSQRTEPDIDERHEPVLVTWKEDRCPGITNSMDPKDELMSPMPGITDSYRECDVPSADSVPLPDTFVLMGNAKEIEGACHQNEETSLNNHGFRERDKSAPKDQTDAKSIFPAVVFSAETTAVLKEPRKSSERLKPMEVLAPTLTPRGSIGALKDRRDGDIPKHEQAKKDLFAKRKIKTIQNQSMPAKSRVEAVPKASKSQLEPKLLPKFESFTIEEEEGSGGYGTVYRARRKEDEKIFAIKYPHANAHSHHINNELKMLERFGGRNFVIKYEGSFKSGDSECFVLEHVEHDRPEVLKKEIDIVELQWYGYCMFRALASLHKQGIVHRDIKPGNFLFSRKLNKGYLIDFNLANDLNQKFGRNSKSDTSSNINHPVSLPNMKPDPYTQARRRLNGGVSYNLSKEATNDTKRHLKNIKKRPNKGQVDTKYGSQTADASGVTSAKDHTSTRTPSGDRLKQPIPCIGRKELLSFVQEAMQSPNQKAVTVTAPVSQRKRVAAPHGKLDRRLVMLTPMPLHSGGNAVPGAGMFRNKGNGKQKREGPCVGTKGFRAPEVLFKSYHQGCKVDVWSAGVTLLYLIIGRTPFVGDPEQNIKDIAKLRGSEDLWEVAKLHNCESSFPEDLLEVQSLEYVELREWCVMNTRRPELLSLAPPSLFDLVDKCLTVNPRRRITAEEALMHNFFAPCHESLRKQRLLRRATGSEPGKL